MITGLWNCVQILPPPKSSFLTSSNTFPQCTQSQTPFQVASSQSVSRELA